MDTDMEHVDQHLWLQCEKSLAAGDNIEEPRKTARIGDEYQAKIPSLMKENERLQLICFPSCLDATTEVQDDILFGLSIPVTFVDSQNKNKEETMEMQANIKDPAKGQYGISGYGTDKDSILVPYSSGESWSKIDHDSFILGLYIFGKNFVLVNKFMGNKGMSNVISYYYGRFYRSSEHKKWSINIRKKKRKTFIPGKKIFKGWRQEELFSRLLPNVTDECKTHLTQVLFLQSLHNSHA